MAHRKVPTGNRPSKTNTAHTPSATNTAAGPSTRTGGATSGRRSTKNQKVKMMGSRKEFDTVIEEAGDKLVMVEFFAEWCGPCKNIGLKLEQLANIYEEKLIIIKVDVDSFEDLVTEHDVTSMPTFMIFRKKAKLSQFVGSDEKNVVKHLSKHLEMQETAYSAPATNAQPAPHPPAASPAKNLKN